MILSSAPPRGQQSGSASYTCLMSAAQPLQASRAVGERAGIPVLAAGAGRRWARWLRVLPACRRLGAGPVGEARAPLARTRGGPALQRGGAVARNAGPTSLAPPRELWWHTGLRIPCSLSCSTRARRHSKGLGCVSHPTEHLVPCRSIIVMLNCGTALVGGHSDNFPDVARRVAEVAATPC